MSNYASFLDLNNESEYKTHYEQKYCKNPINTHDGIPVYFSKNRFEHAFYKSSRRDNNKDIFDINRAKRIDWIEIALKDSNGDRRVGWDKYKKIYDRSHRVTLVANNYVVVIGFNRKFTKAFFKTAYLADSDALTKILSTPKWQ